MLHLLPTDPAAPQAPIENLWDCERLADYLGYTTATVKAMASRSPDRLPPRAPGWKKRWHPAVVQTWALNAQRAPRKKGRPRAPVQASSMSASSSGSGVK